MSDDKQSTPLREVAASLDAGGRAVLTQLTMDRQLALPAQEPDGEFATFTTWVNKAASWIGGTNPLCADAKGRICRNGGDMMRARDEGAFPVRFWFGEGEQSLKQQRASRAATRRALGSFKFRLREAIHGK